MAEGANSSKGEFLGAMAGLKPSLAEFSHPLDQKGQAWHHWRLTPFVFDERREHKLVHQLQLNMHIHQELFFLRVLPGALECSINILLTAVTMK
jgi:hypothetical protein